MSEKEFKEGDKVIVVFSHFSRKQYSVDFVRKIYKNGNFVLTRNNDQFRPSGWKIQSQSFSSVSTYCEQYEETQYLKYVAPQVGRGIKHDLAKLIALIADDNVSELQAIKDLMIERHKPKEKAGE